MQLLAKTLSHLEALHRAEMQTLSDNADDIHEIEQILQSCRVRFFTTRVRASFGHLLVSAGVTSLGAIEQVATAYPWRASETLNTMAHFEGETSKGRSFRLHVVIL